MCVCVCIPASLYYVLVYDCAYDTIRVHVYLHACVHTPVSAHVTYVCACVCVLCFHIVRGTVHQRGPEALWPPHTLSISHLQGRRGQLALSTVLVPPSGLPFVYRTGKRGADGLISGALLYCFILFLLFTVSCFPHFS